MTFFFCIRPALILCRLFRTGFGAFELQILLDFGENCVLLDALLARTTGAFIFQLWGLGIAIWHQFDDEKCTAEGKVGIVVARRHVDFDTGGSLIALFWVIS